MAAPKIFISHSHNDNAICDIYASELKNRGLDIWYDRMSLDSGQRLSFEIQRELESRMIFIVMLSSYALNSYWVQLETDAYRALVADDPNRILLPIKIAPCEIPLLLRVYKWVDATRLTTNQALQEVLYSVTGNSHRKPALTQPSVKDIKVQKQKLGLKFTVELTITKRHTITTKIKYNYLPPRTAYQIIVDDKVENEIVVSDITKINPNKPQQVNFYIEGVKFTFGYKVYGRGPLSLDVDGTIIV